MNEEKPTFIRGHDPFAEAPISRYSRRTVTATLKKEGFSKKQLNKMEFGRVFKLYLDSSHWEADKIIESMYSRERIETKSHE